MKYWSLLVWVTQFGLSVIFPLCASLLLANWLRSTYGWGVWVTVVLGIVGLLTTVSTVRSCFRALRRDTDKAGSDTQPPTAFNEHD